MEMFWHPPKDLSCHDFCDGLSPRGYELHLITIIIRKDQIIYYKFGCMNSWSPQILFRLSAVVGSFKTHIRMSLLPLQPVIILKCYA